MLLTHFVLFISGTISNSRQKMKKIIFVAFCFLLILQLATSRPCYKRTNSRTYKKVDNKFFVNGKEYSSNFLKNKSNDDHNSGKVSNNNVINDNKDSNTRDIKSQPNFFKLLR